MPTVKMAENCKRAIYLIIFLSATVIGSESDNETPPNFEYIQIFKSIPTLFEYLLDMLEERPEILEKDDVTVFTKRNSNFEPDNNRDERKTEDDNVNFVDATIETDTVTNEIVEATALYSDISSIDSDITGIESKTTLTSYDVANEVTGKYKDHSIMFEDSDSNGKNERNFNSLPMNDKREANEIEEDCTESNNNNKRDFNTDTTEKQYVTVLHEYGSSFKAGERNAVQENYSETDVESENSPKESDISENKLDTNKRIEKKSIYLSDTKMLDHSAKNKYKGTEKREKYPVDKASKKNERRSIGFDSFGGSLLTPEEVEEQMIKVEEMLEEHNRNKRKVNMDAL